MTCKCDQCEGTAEPFTPNDPTMAEMKQLVFDFIDQSGLTLPELMEVYRDYDAFYHGDRRRPDYVDDAKMSYARNQLDEND